MSKNKSAPKPTKSFEESLWETATKLRGCVELVSEGRWNGYETPSIGNTDYA